MRECPKCGQMTPKLGMHNRTVHAPPLVIYSETAPKSESGADE